MKRKKIITIAIAIILVLTSTVSSFAITTIDVPFYKQEKSKWCWATAAQMAGKFLYPSSTKTQTQIVTHVKGSNVNEGGTVSESVDATEFVTNDTIIFAGTFSPFSFNAIKTYINSGIPIQAMVNDGVSGHVYVLYGYNETTSGNYLYIIDPLDGYGKYTSHTNFTNGTWSETRPWYASVV